jgi:hypothetical protein
MPCSTRCDDAYFPCKLPYRQQRSVYPLRIQRIVVRLRGIESVRIVEADRIDCEGVYLVLRLRDAVVARIRADELQGWWIDRRPDTP